MSEEQGPVLYVIVVGFHHKKGCQVEYSYPALVPGAPNECPPGWKYLPTLALPDGSHNFEEDTVYFHLPSLAHSRKTVYGISCFRQIPVEKLKNRTADITRGTVQKSVCVLSKLPLYGHIQVKMALITHAYFEEGDFSKVSLLEDTYHHLNSVLLQNQLPVQNFVGLSARDFVLQWRHKAVLLFKLLLLERKLVFFRSPVQPLCATILTLLSLHPGMIEGGLHQSACIKPSRPMSPMPNFSDDDSSPITPNKKFPDVPFTSATTNATAAAAAQKTSNNPSENIAATDASADASSTTSTGAADEAPSAGVDVAEEMEKADAEKIEVDSSSIDIDIGNRLEVDEEVGGDGEGGGGRSALTRDTSTEILAESSLQNATMSLLANVSVEKCALPLSIFTHGYLCHPYLSLPYMDLLNDCNVRGYVVGATNVLFKQKKQLADVLVEIDGSRIESQDSELRKQLHLTTEDLRFADFVVKHVCDDKHDVFLDGVGWEGGDEWIRAQFRVYLLCLLRTSLLQDGSREIEHFNSSFVAAWRDTHNYKMWVGDDHGGVLQVNPGHPFAGQLSVADMKLRLSHTMQNTEGGRKFNQAMVSTGKAVATTSRAVGGAISQAKGALSSWWTNLLVSPEVAQEIVAEAKEAAEEEDDNVKCKSNSSDSCVNVVENVQDADDNKTKVDSQICIPANRNDSLVVNGDLVSEKSLNNDNNETHNVSAIQTV